MSILNLILCYYCIYHGAKMATSIQNKSWSSWLKLFSWFVLCLFEKKGLVDDRLKLRFRNGNLRVLEYLPNTRFPTHHGRAHSHGHVHEFETIEKDKETAETSVLDGDLSGCQALLSHWHHQQRIQKTGSSQFGPVHIGYEVQGNWIPIESSIFDCWPYGGSHRSGTIAQEREMW